MSETRFTKSLAKHIGFIRDDLIEIIHQLYLRALHHDDSKWTDDERPYYEKSDEAVNFYGKDIDSYEELLKITAPITAPAIKHHFEVSKHHPEHYKNGVNDMSLVDIIEMVCDWHSSAKTRGLPLDCEFNFKRFGIDEQLQKIIENTIKELDNLEK